ncbi:glycosyltransferase family 61 protein [Pinibacter aurantiacus]|uniref:Glycosyltransferase family 61 protein n=1 Tax=Pinibacter aurantiacus TaxID=2851599 RepID=A0A9E2W4I3_9BACT|nr:glycosyltransferase family 61 protein [Pinibacter aurantiacus]MBV4357844.1 glycosyltransferase family 61 protein [Pinibacter aurantiacus]
MQTKEKLAFNIKKAYNNVLKGLNVSSTVAGVPKSCIKAKEWALKNNTKYITIFPERRSHENELVTVDPTVHKIFADEKIRKIRECFVFEMPNGRVWGKDGIVITPDDLVIEDVSMEFGQYKGKSGRQLSVFNRFKLGAVKKINGTVAVIAHPGSNNYHHWLVDMMPRFLFLKNTGYFDKIDFFLFDHNDLPFQKFCLEKLGIKESSIIKPSDRWTFHIQADKLIIPSFPDTLGHVNKEVLALLRDFISPDLQKPLDPKKRIFISRKKALTRKIVNEKELKELLFAKGFVEYYPEDYDVKEVAEFFSDASAITGIHGSGFANLMFCSRGASIVEYVAPLHVDPVYYIIASTVGAQLGYLFSEGERPSENTDLTKHKVDEDLLLDLDKLNRLFTLVNIN